MRQLYISLRSLAELPIRSCSTYTQRWPRRNGASSAIGRGRRSEPRKRPGQCSATHEPSFGWRGRARAADEFGRNVLPIIEAVRKAGASSEITNALNSRGVRSATGGVWHRSAVCNLLTRAKFAKAEALIGGRFQQTPLSDLAHVARNETARSHGFFGAQRWFAYRNLL